MSEPPTIPIADRLKSHLPGRTIHGAYMGDESRGEREDPRVTHVIRWAAGIGSAVITAMLLWIGATMVTMKEDVAVIKAVSQPREQRMERLEQNVAQIKSDIANIDRRIATVEQKP